MDDNKVLAVVRDEPREIGAPIDRYAFEPQNWADAAKMAEALFKSGLLPDDVKTPQAALAIIIQGRELGLSVMQSLRGISVIKGKPAPTAQLMVGLVKKNPLCERMECTSSDHDHATWVTKRRGEAEVRLTWTIEDAERAGLTSSPMYKKFPRNMLKWRAASDLAREVFPDVIGGLYTAEELTDGRVVVDVSPVVEVAPAGAPTPAGAAIINDHGDTAGEDSGRSIVPAAEAAVNKPSDPPPPAPTTPKAQEAERPKQAPKPGSFSALLAEIGATGEEAQAALKALTGSYDLRNASREDKERVLHDLRESRAAAKALLNEARREPGQEG